VKPNGFATDCKEFVRAFWKASVFVLTGSSIAALIVIWALVTGKAIPLLIVCIILASRSSQRRSWRGDANETYYDRTGVFSNSVDRARTGD